MAEKYQARSNGQEFQEKTEKEKREESSAKVAKVAAKGAAEYFAPGVGGQAVDMISQTKAGEKILNAAGKSLSKNPITGRMAKKLDDKGIVDAADGAVNMIGGKTSGGVGNAIGKDASLKSGNTQLGQTGTNSNSGASSKPNSLKPTDNTSNNNEINTDNKSSLLGDLGKDGIGKMLFKSVGKKYVIIACAGFFVFLILMTAVVSAKDFGNLELTNKTTTIIGHGGARNCTVEELEKNLVYVGDSRMVSMQSSLNNQNITFIAENGKGYDWLISTGITQIENKISANPDSVIVLGLGVNDLYNIDKYIEYYNSLIEKYPDTQFFFLSVNPVDESLTTSNGYSVTNAEINSFNEKLKNAMAEKYLDSNSTLSTVGTSDGVHYDIDTNKNIHESVITGINGSGCVSCGASSNLNVSLETIAKWYIENVGVYNQKKYFESPFTSSKVRADCTGFAVAYMSFISGSDIPISWSGEMVYPDGSWAKSASNAGWKAYSSDEVGALQTGDVLIAHSGALYSTKGHHAEVYVDETHTFGWGSVKTSYPTNNTISTSTEGGHTHFRDSSHDYITVYRYQGA